MLQVKINAFTWIQAFTFAIVGYNQKKSEKDKKHNCTRIKEKEDQRIYDHFFCNRRE
jgi:hypothetical protein